MSFFELFVLVSTNNLELVVQDLGADGLTERREEYKDLAYNKICLQEYG